MFTIQAFVPVLQQPHLDVSRVTFRAFEIYEGPVPPCGPSPSHGAFFISRIEMIGYCLRTHIHLPGYISHAPSLSPESMYFPHIPFLQPHHQRVICNNYKYSLPQGCIRLSKIFYSLFIFQCMELLGICAVCGATARRTCALCGRTFCEKHITAGVCIWCSGGKMKNRPVSRRSVRDL